MTVLLLAATGCSRPTPAQAFDTLARAAEAGEAAAFTQGFTAESRIVIESLIDLRTSTPSTFALGFSTATRAGEAEIQPDGQLALLPVRVEGGESGQVVMRWEDGAWRLDLMATENYWNRRWEASGGRSRRLPDWFEPMDGLIDGPGAPR